MNAFQFAAKFDAIDSHHLCGKAAHVSIHTTRAENGFAVLVFDENAQAFHQLPRLTTRDAAYAAVNALRDQFYA